MIKKLVALVSYKVRGRAMQFDRLVTDYDLLSISFSRLLSIINGLIRLRQLVMVGSSVKLKSKRNLYISKGVSIGNYTVLDGLGKRGLHIGSASSIGAFSLLQVSGSLTHLGEKIVIGKNVGIGDFAHIGGAGGVVIGDDTIIGAYLSVHPENHLFDDISRPIRLQGVSHQGIRVGKGCWLGAKVTLLDGAVVGDGCVIAAGAVVKGEFPDNCVLAGIPARVIKTRS